MTIEQQVFNKYHTSEDKLRSFGFEDNNGKMVYKRDLDRYGMLITVKYDGSFEGTVTDVDLGEEYTNYRLEIPGNFSSEIKKEFIKCLEEIRDACCERNVYRYRQTERINAFIQDKYDTLPEYPWGEDDGASIYRNYDNGKWYLLNISVARNKLDKASESSETVEVINIRIDNSALEELLRIDGIYKAYHMNKKNWITITMDDSLPDEEVQKLIINSYEIVKNSGKKSR